MRSGAGDGVSDCYETLVARQKQWQDAFTRVRASFLWASFKGEGRTQGTLFPVTLDELIPQDHVCRVLDAFVDRLDMAGLGFERAEPGETGRPGYDPRGRGHSVQVVADVVGITVCEPNVVADIAVLSIVVDRVSCPVQAPDGIRFALTFSGFFTIEELHRRVP